MAFIASLISGCTIRSRLGGARTSLKLDLSHQISYCTRFPRMYSKSKVHHRSDRDVYEEHVLRIRGKLKLTSHSPYTSNGRCTCLPNNGRVVSGLLVVVARKWRVAHIVAAFVS